MSLAIDLSGRTAVVTGASRGIGRAICRTLAEAGADIIGVSSAGLPPESETARLVAETGRSFTGEACDFSSREAVTALAEQLAARQDISILVNNAGTIRRAPAADHPLADWDDVMAVNCDAPFILTQALGKAMLERGHGHVVFVASVLSFQGGILVPGYAASKGAVAQLVRAFANEWAAHGVNVNGIAPGYIATDNTQALQEDAAREAALMARVPAGRWGKPEEIAAPVAFLCSDLARFIHGAIIPADGGWLAR
ncbi:MAG: SDR family oxidoreductase [Zhengella sp.]|uniref:SDR family oxidoreductase n=1 Tax=Zhengella sp. TaxID=2282762 RepID=UPI001D3F914D|nr:SDR family oxidoreductase [Notoacmeibacter sp.]MCC0026093.1 SDR family oxidoreductase [Brucellaceae bacterium]